jgi:transcriptional regulator with XRE-family HTH domain
LVASAKVPTQVTKPTRIDRHVGSRVRIRRMIVGMTMRELGEALGITLQQVQKYEKGTNRIGASRLQQFARVLGVPVEFFFEGAPPVSRQGVVASDVSGGTCSISCRRWKACSWHKPSCASPIPRSAAGLSRS